MTDIDRAVKFYTEVFGLELRRGGERQPFFNVGDHQFLALYLVPERAPDRNRHFGIIVKDERALRVKASYFDDEDLGQSRLSLRDLKLLTARDVVALRSTKEARNYFKCAERAAKETDPLKAGKHLEEGFSWYLPKLALEIASNRTGSRKSRATAERNVQLVKWTSLCGGTGLALVSIGTAAGTAHPWLGFAVGTIWAFGGLLLDSATSRKTTKVDSLVLYRNEQWNQIVQSQGEHNPVIGVSESGGPQF